MLNFYRQAYEDMRQKYRCVAENFQLLKDSVKSKDLVDIRQKVKLNEDEKKSGLAPESHQLMPDPSSSEVLFEQIETEKQNLPLIVNESKESSDSDDSIVSTGSKSEMKVYKSMMELTSANKELTDLISSIESSLNRVGLPFEIMHNLTLDILDLAQLKRGNLRINNDYFDLNSVIRKAFSAVN